MFVLGPLMSSHAVQYTYRCGCSETVHFTSPVSWHQPPRFDLLPTPHNNLSLSLHKRSDNEIAAVLIENEDCHDCWEAEAELAAIKQSRGPDRETPASHDGDVHIASHDGTWRTTQPTGSVTQVEHGREPLREISENLKPKLEDRVRM